jgi:pyruvate formate lyase activating enzyme
MTTRHEHEFGSSGCTYEVLEGGKVRCLTCAHECVIAPGQTGICAVRKNVEGALKLIVYGHASSANGRDPIEKKPLYHVMPGHPTFSIATVGCNFACSFCQNWDLSQCTKDLKRELQKRGAAEMIDVEVGNLGYLLMPEQVVAKAVESGCHIVAYTYSEPTIFFEYAIDTARLAHARGLKNVFKSNGYESADTVDKMVGLIDAANIDLKSFSDAFYRRLCKARLEPVLATIRRLVERGIWTEVTTLVIPGENDSDEELAAIAQFLVSVSADIPWHVTPFHPDYQMADKQRTPDSTLDRAYEIGKRAGLKFVYARSDVHSCTFCPGCGAQLIRRQGIRAATIVPGAFQDGKCLRCGLALPGVWK